MKAKLFAMLLLAIAIILIGDSAVTSNGITENGKANAVHPVGPINAVGHMVDVPGTIDGAVNPEKIPDRSAYLMLFRLVANRRSAAEQQSIRAYLRSVAGLGRPQAGPQLDNGDADIDTVIAAAEEFNERVAPLEGKAAEIKDRVWPNPTPDDMSQLAELQRQKEALLDEISSSLLKRLSRGGAVRLLQHINQYVKRRVKLIPEPSTPPGGAGWQPGTPAEMHVPHH